METKGEIRKRIRECRDRMAPSCRRAASGKIAETLLGHPWFLEAGDIYCYMSFGSEVDTEPVIREAQRLGKRVWAPVVSGGKMEFYLCKDPSKCSPGVWGIPEPETRVRSDGTSGLLLMPGVAFDLSRSRIGYGGGYYDRYLSAHRALHTIAAAFDIQIVEQIQAEETDIRPEILVTESRILQ